MKNDFQQIINEGSKIQRGICHVSDGDHRAPRHPRRDRRRVRAAATNVRALMKKVRNTTIPGVGDATARSIAPADRVSPSRSRDLTPPATQARSSARPSEAPAVGEELGTKFADCNR